MDTVLIVSQDKGIRESIKMVLKNEFLVMTAGGGKETIAILRESPLDLVILDTPIPDTDISTFVEEIRDVKDEAGIVMLSALKQNVLGKVKSEGVYEVVSKPFQKEDLLNVLKKAQERSKLLTELKLLRLRADKVSAAGPQVPSEKFGEEKSALQAPYHYQEAMRKFSKALTYVFDSPKLFDSVVTAIAEIFEVNKVCILLKDETGSEYGVKASTGFQEDIAREIRLKGGEGIAGWLHRERQILRREDLSMGEHLPEHLLMRKQLDMLGAYLCLPLSTRGDLIAIISMGKKTAGDKFTYEDIRFLTTMANYAALSISNSFLYQEVRFQRNHHQIIMGNIPTGIIAVDNEGKITTLNRAGRKILGLGEAEIIGEDIQRAGSIIADIMLRTLKGEKAYNRHEAALPGKKLCLGISTSLLKKENEEVIGGVMVFTNLTKVRAVDEEIRRLGEENLWRKFTEGIAHEIRNPLVSIRTFTQLFMDKYKDKEFRKDFYRIMGGDVKKLNGLIDKLEKYTEPLSLSLQSDDLNSIIDEVLVDFKDDLASQNIPAHKNYSSGIPRIIVDRDQLAEAFSHIIRNSIEAMLEGGTLTLSTRVEKEGAEEVVIEFSDTGRGIPLEDMGKLFSPFFSTRLKGLGLGLPIAQKIIEAHEGRIEVDSIPGKKTSFKIFLPVSLSPEKAKKKGIPAKLYPEIKSRKQRK
jgi:PAS domain S-box-containing protein